MLLVMIMAIHKWQFPNDRSLKKHTTHPTNGFPNPKNQCKQKTLSVLSLHNSLRV